MTRLYRPIATRLFVGLALALALSSWTGCGDEAPAARGLLIVGIDSADWTLLDPMIAEGRLPHLASFRETSASGRMETLVPLTKSPILWASIFTGVRPETHGIGGFVEEDGMEITGASSWQAATLWDIAGASGLSTTVLGMWSTHPARPIEGVMVSDFLPYGHGRNRAGDGLVHPDSLTAGVLARSVDPSSLGAADLARFVPDGRVDEALAAFPDAMEELATIFAADLGYLETARWLAAEHPTDVTIFYLRGPDMISHRFWRYFEPDKSTQSLDDLEGELLGEVVARYYEWADEALGEALSWFPADHPTVVLSDHGFWGPRKSGRKGTHEHSKWGVFLVRSPLYEPGSQFDSLHLYDVGPTLLGLLGMPPADDMPGRILPDALTDAGRRQVERLERDRIESYRALCPTAVESGEVDPAVSEEIRRQLESLGYLN